MKRSATGDPSEARLVSRVWGWMRGRRDTCDGDRAVPVEAGRVQVVDGATDHDDSPFDTTLDGCSEVLTSAPRLNQPPVR
jgi:hypothetical protein